MLETFIDYFLHLDVHLTQFVELYGPWVYGLLFLIVFAETGLVVTPFLPGDSLLFATGALAATGAMNGPLAVVLLIVAAILGDAVNYAIGHFIGPKIFSAQAHDSFFHRLLNRDHLQQAHAFYEKYGGKAVVLGRFVPIVRTFVPFVAGCGSMSYRQFVIYNVVGALLWVGSCLGAGYAFGNVPVVKENFSLVVLGIVFVSILPMVWGFIANRRKQKAG